MVDVVKVSDDEVCAEGIQEHLKIREDFIGCDCALTKDCILHGGNIEMYPSSQTHSGLAFGSLFKEYELDEVHDIKCACHNVSKCGRIDPWKECLKCFFRGHTNK